MDLLEMLYSFWIYSVLGWIAEVIYAALHHKKLVNRGFLNGPVCPIYGVGMVVIILVLGNLRGNIILLFLVSVIVATLLEWLTGYLLERLFHRRWWDYSEIPGNIEGYICPLFSLAWGIVCSLVIRFVHPVTEVLIGKIPVKPGSIVLIVLFAMMAFDLYSTVKGIQKTNLRLQKLQELLGDRERVAARLGKKHQELLHGSGYLDRRMFRAFPSMKHLQYQQALQELRAFVLKQKN